jgi:hypothetical protein
MLAKLSNMIKSLFGGAQSRELTPHARRAAAALDAEEVKSMVRGIVTTRPDEIDCDRCFEELDRFVEATLAGKNAAEAMPLVQDHLERCRDCREEYEALLTALRALA